MYVETIIVELVLTTLLLIGNLWWLFGGITAMSGIYSVNRRYNLPALNKFCSLTRLDRVYHGFGGFVLAHVVAMGGGALFLLAIALKYGP